MSVNHCYANKFFEMVEINVAHLDLKSFGFSSAHQFHEARVQMDVFEDEREED
jgi:hypothetical protein